MGQVDPHRAPELVPWDHDTQPTFLHCSGGWAPAQEEALMPAQRLWQALRSSLAKNT